MNRHPKTISRLLDRLAAHPFALACAAFVTTAIVIAPADALASLPGVA
jgi:hypothetical protein